MYITIKDNFFNNTDYDVTDINTPHKIWLKKKVASYKYITKGGNLINEIDYDKTDINSCRRHLETEEIQNKHSLRLGSHLFCLIASRCLL